MAINIYNDNDDILFNELRSIIETSKRKAFSQVNSSLVKLYWNVGHTIDKHILKKEKANYGEATIESLSKKLAPLYGRGFQKRSLFRMVKFSRLFPDFEIVSTLSTQLSWSHFVELLVFEDSTKRTFYTEMCRIELWSVRELRKKIDGMLYERTAISKEPDELIKHDLKELVEKNALSESMVFKDPYILDFLNLPPPYSETDLENAILDDLINFLKELGTDFCFIDRQKRIIVDNEDHYIDLLMYHRGLNRLVAIELKLGRFKAAYKGQLELYLKWLDKYERKPNEDAPLGLILCADKQREHVELLEMGRSGIHVAQYFTEMPDKSLLEERLKMAIKSAGHISSMPSSKGDKSQAKY